MSTRHVPQCETSQYLGTVSICVTVSLSLPLFQLYPLLSFLFNLIFPLLFTIARGPLYQTNKVRSRLIATNIEVSRFGNEGASVGIIEDSAREVPTGPDPLHHNNHPIDP
ncbi:hypothetical protein VNO77_36260 [Canavalia gladiata]|uniref:Uncharacterized protein n=1 Tax=Canavalia gladiata TaxID=3824 RepID=A0AAN9K7T4_CANGL